MVNRMVQHVVLLQPKEEASEEEIRQALMHVQALQEKIPGISEVKIGVNLNQTNNKGYTYGFVMNFVDRAHLQAYGPHPEHQLVAAELTDICSSIIDFDLE
jgi:Stress responsive A/B Barrel Domain